MFGGIGRGIGVETGIVVAQINLEMDCVDRHKVTHPFWLGLCCLVSFYAVRVGSRTNL